MAQLERGIEARQPIPARDRGGGDDGLFSTAGDYGRSAYDDGTVTILDGLERLVYQYVR
jgi:hypothetical protein